MFVAEALRGNSEDSSDIIRANSDPRAAKLFGKHSLFLGTSTPETKVPAGASHQGIPFLKKSMTSLGLLHKWVARSSFHFHFKEVWKEDNPLGTFTSWEKSLVFWGVPCVFSPLQHSKPSHCFSQNGRNIFLLKKKVFGLFSLFKLLRDSSILPVWGMIWRVLGSVILILGCRRNCLAWFLCCLCWPGFSKASSSRRKSSWSLGSRAGQLCLGLFFKKGDEDKRIFA